MPQMAVGGLSESWLFKELGDMHWMMICDALRSRSQDIMDGLGNRLYPTFVRIRIEFSQHLKTFQENERFRIKSKLSRFGKSMFFSSCAMKGSEKEIGAALMTTFALRQSNNKSLLKGEPRIPAGCQAAVMESMPAFGEEYRRMRKGEGESHELAGIRFDLDKNTLFEMDYRLNPYQDLNGVNLLYFAAYPMISDIGERAFANRDAEKLRLKTDWSLAASTIARDVFYYSNCDLDDELSYRVHSFAPAGRGKVKIASSLSRKRDGQRLADIFTVKERHG